MNSKTVWGPLWAQGAVMTAIFYYYRIMGTPGLPHGSGTNDETSENMGNMGLSVYTLGLFPTLVGSPD